MTPEHIIIIVSIVGGLIGGMGLGGGTLLIPLLTMSAGLEQHLAQAINLIAFVPMSITALVIHRSNGYVRFSKAIPIAMTALVGAVCGSFATKFAQGYALRALFGAFLIALGLYQSVRAIAEAVKKLRMKRQGTEIGVRR